jgi:hypothetical protein
MKPSILLSAALLALAACATSVPRRPAAPEPHYADYAGPVIEDFHFFRLDGWEAVSRNELVVWTGLQEAYLLKVWDSCEDLNFAIGIGITSSFNRVSRMDRLKVGHQRCPIQEIRRIDVARMKADRAKAHEKPAT